ncbi:MAG: hypothetical protein K8R74_16700, partial [Bacteroidales bacterium]|nr:hypothetical protein [Bacteroidales bacterium]
MKTFIINLIFLVSSTVLLNAQSITFQLPEIPNPGATVAVPLSVVQCNLGCCQAGAFQIFIEYNPTVLSPIDVNYTNPNLPFYEWSVNLGYSPNLIMVTWLSFTGSTTFQPPEELCEIVFTYTGGCSDLIMTGDGGNCTYIFENGSVGCNPTLPEATLRLLELGPEPEGSIFQPIIFDNINGNIGYAEFYILYDPSVLTPLFVTYPNTDYLFYEWLNNLSYGPNEIILTWLSFSGGVYPESGDTMCIIEFDYIGVPGYSDLTWNHYEKDSIEILQKGNTSLWTWDGTSFELNLIDGGIGPLSGGSYWTGLVDSDWDNPQNWLGMSPPTEVYVCIRNSNNQPIIYSEAFAVILYLFPRTSLTIASTGNLTVSQSIINLSEINIKSNKYGKSGSLITNEIEYIPYGQFKFEKNINTLSQTGNINSWHNVSSPIDNFSSDYILDYYVNNWNETFNNWEVISNGDPCNPTTPPIYLNVMQGWSVKLNQDIPITCPPGGTGTIIEFSGSITNLHGGSYSIPFTANTTGYNLLGNPYPSYVDPSLINWPINLNQAIYFKDGWTDCYWSWVGGIGPNIPPTQGFFVKAT